MVKTCCVYRCKNRANSHARLKNISFFRFPANKRKQQAWIKAINRKDWEPNGHSHVCSEHFVFGWHSDEPSDVNYAPTLFQHRENKKSRALEKVKEWREADKFQKECHGEGSSDSSSCSRTLDIPLPADQNFKSDQSEMASDLADNHTERLQQNISSESPDHLKDHGYCRQMPWPGKKQSYAKSSKPKMSRESAAETLLSLCGIPLNPPTQTNYTSSNALSSPLDFKSGISEIVM